MQCPITSPSCIISVGHCRCLPYLIPLQEWMFSPDCNRFRQAACPFIVSKPTMRPSEESASSLVEYEDDPISAQPSQETTVPLAAMGNNLSTLCREPSVASDTTSSAPLQSFSNAAVVATPSPNDRDIPSASDAFATSDNNASDAYESDGINTEEKTSEVVFDQSRQDTDHMVITRSRSREIQQQQEQ